MRINNASNASALTLFRSKMSEDVKPASDLNTSTYLEKNHPPQEVKIEPNLTYDHLYTHSDAENGEVNFPEPYTQSEESEVKFWKEVLILHLDLIQQQNDDILNKERTIVLLQRENEMLKERLSCLESGASFTPHKFNHTNCEELPEEAPPETVTNCENGEVKSECEEVKECPRLEFTVEPSDSDPMKNLRVNIRRKRLSNSSAVSNNESVTEEKRSFRKIKKRRKRVLKDSQILTTGEHYVTEMNRLTSRLIHPADTTTDFPDDTNLEVPRWRIKVYGSCYAMEGTENLDDEVFHKRHARLENDERRRKRWDVQRIREQRVIEKLKLRQERIGSSGSRTEEHPQTEVPQSLWPNIDEIKCVEVCEQLPVAAFGTPVPKVQPSEFALPWLSNPSLFAEKKLPTKKSTGRRKTKR